MTFFIFVFKDFLSLFLERGEGRERTTDVREKHQLVASCKQPDLDEPTTQARALTGNQTSDLSLCRMTPNHVSHTGQGQCDVLKI